VAAKIKRDIPELQGWLSLPVAAERAGISRQWLFEMVSNTDSELKNVRQVAGTGDRPACILVREAEIERLMEARKTAQGCPQCRQDVEAACAAGQPADFAKVICPHGTAPAAAPELENALGL
jgi:hypothetical protein